MAGKNDKKYYILRKDVVGSEKQKKFLLRDDYVDFIALKGSIYLMTPSKYDPEEKCTFTSVDNDSKSIICGKEDVYPLELKEFLLLVPIPSNIERLILFKSTLFEKIKRAKEGEFASIDIESSNGIKSVVGAIRYIGAVKKVKGYMFGLQLKEPIGDSNGIIDGMPYFPCHENYGIFVTANRLKDVFKKSEINGQFFPDDKQKQQSSQPSQPSKSLPTKGTEPNNKDSKKKRNQTSQSKKIKKKKEDIKDCPGIEVGARVVYFGVEGKIVSGTIKFAGKLDKNHDVDEIIIETDNLLHGRSMCSLHKWNKIKLNLPGNSLVREKTVVVEPNEVMLEEVFKNKERDEATQGKKITEPDLICPVCDNILQNAVRATCCCATFCADCSEDIHVCPVCKSNKMEFIPSHEKRRLVLEFMSPHPKEPSLIPETYEEKFKKEQEQQFNKINNTSFLPGGVVIHQPPSLASKDPNAPNYPGKGRSNSSTPNDLSKDPKVQESANFQDSAELKAQSQSFGGAPKGKAGNAGYNPQSYSGNKPNKSSNDPLRDLDIKSSSDAQGIDDFKGSNKSFAEATKGSTGTQSFPSNNGTQSSAYSVQPNNNLGLSAGGSHNRQAHTGYVPEDQSGKLPKNNGGHESARSNIATVQPSPREAEEKMDLDVNYGRPAFVDEPVYEEISSIAQQEEDKQHFELTIGMMVEVVVKGSPTYGVVRWLGDVEIDGRLKLIAGLELEDYSKFGTSDGSFQGQRYFTCPAGKGLFIKAKICKPDRRFFDTVARNQTNIEIPMASHHVQQQQEIKPFEAVVLQGYYPPRPNLAPRFVGYNKGIMGHHNSCYMDSTLFAMFAYTDVFDVALHRRERKGVVNEYEEVQRLLKEEIVNPLRTSGFVNRESVLKLRKILDKHAKIPGFMSEEKDPEELFVLLFEEVLKLDPFIKLRTMGGHVNTSLLYQIFPPEIERTRYPPSIQWLLELSLIDSGLFIDEIPSVLALQMPRFGQQKMFERIFINRTLNLTNILHCIRKYCAMCGQKATSVCKDCTRDANFQKIGFIFFCDGCCGLIHRHTEREKHEPAKLPPVDCYYDENYINCEMELFAVVSINTSHYVSFVKCDDNEWVFFDSMADRKGDDQNGYNIPQVTHLTDLKTYLQGDILDVVNLKKKVHDEKLLRFYEDASLCLYRNKQFMGYQ